MLRDNVCSDDDSALSVPYDDDSRNDDEDCQIEAAAAAGGQLPSTPTDVRDVSLVSAD